MKLIRALLAIGLIGCVAASAQTVVPGGGTSFSTIGSGGSAAMTAVEAPWTPADASGAGLSFTSVNARYQRIGNMVFAYGAFTYPATANGSAANVNGLPITVPAGAGSGVCAITYSTIALARYWIPSPGQTGGLITGTDGNALTNAQLTTGSFRVMCVYPAV